MSEREVRLGLVLYGGVSLAIYENGIVQEIYRAIRGDGVYGLISELIDSDIVVDVISGTSAGGVNGVMLAYALANKGDFLKTADRWRNLGDIQELLRKPGDTDDASLLDSTYYQEQLELCYAAVQAPLTDGSAPEISELDLFVTGTDANGVISTVYDDLGHPIDVKNHRAVFQLQYRGERKNDFKEAEIGGVKVAVTPDHMATLSRLTSGFPVAFKPVSIGSKQQDPNFYRWGKLSGPAVYMDGGILANKPFTTTISAIASRTATREVERFLIYVEPSPERFMMPDGEPRTPNLVQAGVSSLTSIPSYQSIAGDLQAIEAHNERSLKMQKIVEGLGGAPPAGKDCLDTVSVVPAGDDRCAPETYRIGRFLLLKDAAVEAILNDDDGNRAFFETEAAEKLRIKQAGRQDEKPSEDRRSGRLLVQSFSALKLDPRDADSTLIQYDVYFRKRRADYLTSVLMKATKRTEKPMKVPLQAWEAVNHFFKLYEITEWAMTSRLTAWNFEWKELSGKHPDLDTLDETKRAIQLANISGKMWTGVKQTLEKLMTCDVEVPAFFFTPGDDSAAREKLAEARESYYDALTKWLKANRTSAVPAPVGVASPPIAPSGGKGQNLLLRLDTALAKAIGELESVPKTYGAGLLLRNEFCRFLDVDRQLLPIQIGSGFEATDVIRVVRFSPLDAQRAMSAGVPTNKVRGTALANFGAFFKKGWRANDIMMGRLDSACLLTECLLTKERLAAMSAKWSGAHGRAEVAKLVARTMPKAGAALTAAIDAYFAAPKADAWEVMIDAIVVAAHEKIVAEEWPIVAQCTLDQQYEWGQYQKEQALPTWLEFPAKCVAGKASPDELLVRIAANAISTGQLPPFDPRNNKAKPFLDEVPVTAMQEHASLALVRLGKSLLASVPEGKARDTVKGNPIFKVTMQWLPGYFYRLVHTRRTQPDWMLVPIVIFLNLALIAVLVFAWMLQQKHSISLTYAVLATAGVAAAGLAQWVLTNKDGWRAKVGIFVPVLMIAGCGLFAVYLQYGAACVMESHHICHAIRAFFLSH